jgi:SNF2 family DNA or RNA helicase
MHFKIPLWDHQLKALEFTKDKQAAAIFHEPGCGKTATAINILRRIYNEERRLLVTLILSPAVTLENWKREIAAHSGEKMSLATKVLTGNVAARGKVIKENTGKAIFITNHEALDNATFLMACKQRGIEVLVVDECHRFKNPMGTRTKRVHLLADGARYKYILTGSPVLNSPVDLWGQLRILGHV